MVKVFCAIFGVAGRAFPLDIDKIETVGDLKDAIKAKKPATIKCPARNLQLFLTKTESGEWLKSKNPLVRQMQKGEKPQKVESFYMKKELDDPTDKISTILPREIPEGTIHVLVVVSKDAGLQAGVTASPTIEDLGDIVEARVNKVLEERDNKRSIWALSGLTEGRQRKW